MLKRKGKVWQNESYDRVIRNEDEFLEKLNYIASNPTRLLTLERSDGGQVKASLARRYEDYRWLYIKGWIKDI